MRQKYLVQVTEAYALHETCGNIKKHQREMLQLKEEEEEEAVKKIAPSLWKEKERKSLTKLFLLIFLVLEVNLSNANVGTTYNIIIAIFLTFSLSKLQFYHKQIAFFPFPSLFNQLFQINGIMLFGFDSKKCVIIFLS